MKRSTFFILAAMIIVLIAGYFTIQLTSEAEWYCWAQFELECDAYAQPLSLSPS